MIVQGDVHRPSGVNRLLLDTLCYRKWRKATQTSYSWHGTWSHPLKLRGRRSCQLYALAARAPTSDPILLTAGSDSLPQRTLTFALGQDRVSYNCVTQIKPGRDEVAVWHSLSTE